MTNDLVVTNELLDAIREEGRVKKTSWFPPKVTQNKLPDTDDGIRLPLGAYTVKYEGTPIYMKETKLRLGRLPLYQYQSYDVAAQQMRCVTVLEHDPFTGQYPDSIGTFKCGKKTGKQVEELTEDEQKINKDLAKYTLILFAQMDIRSATYADGTSVHPVLHGSSENTPVWHEVALQYYGARALKVSNALMKIYGDHSKYELYINLTPSVRDKAGENIFYVAQFARGETFELGDDPEYLKYIVKMKETIIDENDRIMKLHIKANNEPLDIPGLDVGIKGNDYSELQLLEGE